MLREEACLYMLYLHCNCSYHASWAAISGCCLDGKNTTKVVSKQGGFATANTRLAKCGLTRCHVAKVVMNETDCTDALQPDCDIEVTSL